MNIRRVLRLIKKEMIQTRRDRRMIGMIFLAPIMQLFLFGYVVTTDINHINTAVYDQDRTPESRQFVDRFIRSGYFDYKYFVESPAEADQLLNTGKAQVVLHIPRNFALDISRNRSVQVQALMDGSDSSTASIINGYATGVVQQYSGDLVTLRLEKLRAAVPRLPQVDGRIRVWYNPELKSVYFMVPAVLCMILLMITMMMTSLAIVKEKEIGTLEQLIVTPITPAELMLGKTLPFLLFGLLDMIAVLLISIYWFHVHVVGSVVLLFLLSGIFLLTTLGGGIFISTISHTIQEATLTTFFFLLPSMLLSGFMFPIHNMPRAVQFITYIIPLRYFLDIIRGIFLKGIGLDVLWPQVLILALFGIGILTLSSIRFHKRME